MCYIHHWKGILNSFCSLYYIKVHGKNGEGIIRFFLIFCVISFPYMTFIAIFMSADIMASLCSVRVCVRVRVTNFFSKTTRPRDMLFFLKDTLTIEDDKS